MKISLSSYTTRQKITMFRNFINCFSKKFHENLFRVVYLFLEAYKLVHITTVIDFSHGNKRTWIYVLTYRYISDISLQGQSRLTSNGRGS